MFRTVVKWSCCELDYLKAHRDEVVTQLSGYLGKSRAAVKRKLDELDGKVVEDKRSGKRTNIGKRADLGGLFVRSSWEANLARYLSYKGKQWSYEPEVFVFSGVKHGTVSYCPDFKVKYRNSYLWIEVKGQLKDSDKTRIRRFKKFYPDEFKKLRVVVGSPSTKAAKFFEEMGVPILYCVNDLNKQCKGKVPHWE